MNEQEKLKPEHHLYAQITDDSRATAMHDKMGEVPSVVDLTHAVAAGNALPIGGKAGRFAQTIAGFNPR